MRAAEMTVEPEAEVMQRNLGGDARLHAGQGVRPLPIEAEGVDELVDDRFDDVGTGGGRADAGAARIRVRSQGEESVGKRLILGAARREGKPGDRADGR